MEGEWISPNMLYANPSRVFGLLDDQSKKYAQYSNTCLVLIKGSEEISYLVEGIVDQRTRKAKKEEDIH